MLRRSPRASRGGAASAAASPEPPIQSLIEESNDDESENEDEQVAESNYFEGVSYPSYQDMVNAKRKRNQQVLIDSGLAAAADEFKASRRRVTLSSQKRRKPAVTPLPRRSSNRIKGIQSDGMYVEHESSGRFVVGSTSGEGGAATSNTNGVTYVTPKPSFYGNRINDGSDITVRDANANANGDEEEALLAERFIKSLSSRGMSIRASSNLSHSVATSSNLSDIQVESVAKVTRDRIYSIATHPSTDQLVVAAGDKQGNVGIWKVDSDNDDDNSCFEFKYHSGAVNFLQFINTKILLSCSYDGTVRLFDFEKQCASQVFATFDDSDEFKGRLGYDLDTGYNYWTQNACLDHRVNDGLAFFASTSTGMVFHVDLRANKLTFHKELSVKKINTVSLHPNGYSLLTAGLDCQVTLWDVRKFASKKRPAPVTSFHSGKSVNSAYFSPSGKYAVSTTMSDKLDIFTDLHLSGPETIKPSTRIPHDNRTGRWLSTFMATWHPSLDIFCVGSMRRPREIQVFDPSGNVRNIVGDDLTAVASRCCFHPRADKLTIAGGNSSGRVTIVR
ncbi:hypothetical protein MPSEU_001051800 [Mayamaea pseudoterrestris]|nr:hypothetical protein MPSEU_001051800 [Mayamaea pseudoterrestris]